MQFKPAAGIFVGGITMSICGPVLAVASSYFASMALARGDQATTNLFFLIAALGLLISLVGFIMLIVATYRALVKIDALPTGPTARRRDY